MSRSRDIANFLGKTEITNAPNNALLNTASSVGLDSAQVLAIAGGVTTYSTVDDLPSSNLTSGDQAYVQSTNRLYISNGSGWYNIALVNTAPSISRSGTSPYELDNTGSSSTVITVTGSDPEELPVTITSTNNSAFDDFATITQNGSNFTITPKASAIATATDDTGTVTFRASDGINITQDTVAVNLTFPNLRQAFLDWAANDGGASWTADNFSSVPGIGTGTFYKYYVTNISSLSEATMWGTPWGTHFTNDSSIRRVVQHSVSSESEYLSLVSNGDPVYMRLYVTSTNNATFTSLDRNGYTSLSYTNSARSRFGEIFWYSSADNKVYTSQPYAQIGRSDYTSNIPT